MKKIILALALSFVTTTAFAQGVPNSATVVSTCGNQTYTAGQNRPLTQDTTGSTCTTPSNVSASNVNLTGINGVAPSVGNGATDTGTLKVTVSNDSTGRLAISQATPGTSNAVSATNFPATVAVGTGAQNSNSPRFTAAQDTATIAGSAPGTAGTPSANVVSVQGVSGGTNLPVSQATAANLNAQVVGAVASGVSDSGNPVKIGARAETTDTTVTTGQISNLKATLNGALKTAVLPTSDANAAITAVVSTAAESNHVLKASAGNLYGVSVTSGATAGFLMVFNATSAPADGAVTPIQCVVVPANNTVGLTFNSGPPDAYSTGITAVFSSTGCFTKTASATAFFSGRVK